MASATGDVRTDFRTGIRHLFIHGKDEVARQWYETWEFEASPSDACHLFLLLKDLKRLPG